MCCLLVCGLSVLASLGALGRKNDLLLRCVPATILNLRRCIYSVPLRIFSLSKHLSCWRACVMPVAACRFQYDGMTLHCLLHLQHNDVSLYRISSSSPQSLYLSRTSAPTRGVLEMGNTFCSVSCVSLEQHYGIATEKCLYWLCLGIFLCAEPPVFLYAVSCVSFLLFYHLRLRYVVPVVACRI